MLRGNDLNFIRCLLLPSSILGARSTERISASGVAGKLLVGSSVGAAEKSSAGFSAWSGKRRMRVTTSYLLHRVRERERA